MLRSFSSPNRSRSRAGPAQWRSFEPFGIVFGALLPVDADPLEQVEVLLVAPLADSLVLGDRLVE
jgi:hypothetical protein